MQSPEQTTGVGTTGNKTIVRLYLHRNFRSFRLSGADTPRILANVPIEVIYETFP